MVHDETLALSRNVPPEGYVAGVFDVLTFVYEIYFATNDASDNARRRLADLGFEVATDNPQAPIGAPYGLRAAIRPAADEDARARLDEALAGIPHDPIIHYQEHRLVSYTLD